MKFNKKRTVQISSAAVVLVMAATASHAGATGVEFEDAYNTLAGWVNGFLGRAMALAFMIVGLFMGIARQNLIACGVSIAVAFGLLITPTILDNILSTTISSDTLASVDVEAPQAASLDHFTAAEATNSDVAF